MDKETGHGLILSPVTDADLELWGHPTLASSETGDLVKAQGVSLCHAERNANGDGIGVGNIAELAASLDMMPLDVDHRQDKVIGIFVNPSQQDWDRGDTVLKGGALVSDLVLYARRFPALVQEIRDGKRRPSVEARSTHVSCSECGPDKWFASADEYCDHLQPMLIAGRVQDGVTRWHKNMKATGGGAVIHPAGSDTSFGKSFTVIAHESEPQDRAVESLTEADVRSIVTSMLTEEISMTELEMLQEQLDKANARVTELEAEVKASAVLTAQAVSDSRQDRLANAGMPADRIEQLTGQLPVMDKAVFEALLKLQADLNTTTANLALAVAEPVVEPDPVPDVLGSVAVGDEDTPEPKGKFAALNMED